MNESEYFKLSTAEQQQWQNFITAWFETTSPQMGYRNYDWCKQSAEQHIYRVADEQWAAWLVHRAAWRLTR
ncbi:MAG: hypothetical protein JSS14_22115 [Proteobacteria bacterium]|nr:hypothetical protein [Pseudomonadota bacterium]